MFTRSAAALATGVLALVGCSALSGSAAAQSPTPPTGSLDFQVQIRDVRSEFGLNPALPRDKKRPKVADLFAQNGIVLVNGQRTGRYLSFGVTAYEGAKKYRGKAQEVSTSMVDLGDGQLFAVCVAEDSPTPNPCAIVGGLGRYAGARGTAVAGLPLPEQGPKPKIRHMTFPVHVDFIG
jgi:hypothetical protein